MAIDVESLRRHFADLSDEALEEIDRNDLVEAARRCLDEERARRQAAEAAPDPDEVVPGPPPAHSVADDAEPAWLPDAVSAFSVTKHPRNTQAEDQSAEVCEVLRAAGIPNRLVVREPQADFPYPYYDVMVPGELGPHATSIIDRDFFNPAIEESWRGHLSELSDDELRVLDPDIFCAGMRDRAERLARAYHDELARRAGGAGLRPARDRSEACPTADITPRG